jgi:flagellin
VTLAAYDLTIGGPIITVDSASQNTSADVLTGLDASIANVGQALGQIGDQQRQLQSHALFISRLSDVLALGSGANAPPTSADGARLMALQVQQQLAAQGGGIANSAPQVLLSLFK